MPAALKILTKMQATHGGRKVNVTGMHDTGAETFAFINTDLARQLGLRNEGSLSYSGIAGNQVGFKSTLHRLEIPEVPECALENFPVIVGRVPFAGVDLLYGEYYQRSLSMRTDTLPGEIKISCKGGPHVAITQPIPTIYWIIGGALLAGIVITVLLLRD